MGKEVVKDNGLVKDKYEKEREQQAMESKKRLQESREKKEKEAREEKERKRLKEKERREKEKKLEKEREAKKEKEKKEQLEENKSAIKEKIGNLDRDTLKLVLLESLADSDGATLNETDKKAILKKLESEIKEKEKDGKDKKE